MKVSFSLPFLLFPLALCIDRYTRPKELILERDPNSGSCSTIAFRDTQVFRNLEQGESHVSKLKTVHGLERLSVIAHDDTTVLNKAYSLCSDFEALPEPGDRLSGTAPNAQEVLSPPEADGRKPKLKIEPLLRSGPSNNRVDLVFFSDGYLAEEKEKFIADAKRLADDISNNHTFNTVKPLLNFWTAFTPSKESGIGVGGKPKDTPYGLYRDGTELRGVYYSKPEVARAACLSMGDQCDYPILMGNDPFYGGLGGEFTVITPSLANGALVLRHELGHSVIEVGEEYDGGFAYFGVNALNELAAPIPWSHWLSPPPTHTHEANTVTARRRVERSVMPMQAYPWTLLNTSSPWKVQFSSSGQYPRHLARFSLSGLPSASDLSVTLDGKDLPWSPRQDIGIDRWHYDIHMNTSLSDGLHELSFQLKNKKLEGSAQLCSSEILEFGTEEEFVSKPGHYSLYPTFSETNTTSYRPTNEDCLMRIVTTPDFCKACLEGLWLSLLRRVDFIDSISASCEQIGVSPPRFNRVLDLSLVPLAQFRLPPEDDLQATARVPEESYTIRWFKDGAELEEFEGKTRVEVDDKDGQGVGLYTLEVMFKTEEVRIDTDGLLKSGGDFLVAETCGH
ncbi:IgA peptidase M64-domain-containing protein [Cristinia sonorae]|uniref:IgA peptidase M64-domain-containing protein n=1 Tax=Cristinia sonorae TaxID=1940300 RepID=A0A8K0XL46_9AGAR|nr:IgA peptidase M64-domain-containing protein [Cristinia sonorae]